MFMWIHFFFSRYVHLWTRNKICSPLKREENMKVYFTWLKELYYLIERPNSNSHFNTILHYYSVRAEEFKMWKALRPYILKNTATSGFTFLKQMSYIWKLVVWYLITVIILIMRKNYLSVLGYANKNKGRTFIVWWVSRYYSLCLLLVHKV